MFHNNCRKCFVISLLRHLWKMKTHFLKWQMIFCWTLFVVFVVGLARKEVAYAWMKEDAFKCQMHVQQTVQSNRNSDREKQDRQMPFECTFLLLSRVVRKTSKRDFIVVLNVYSTAQTSEIVSFSFYLFLLDIIMSSEIIPPWSVQIFRWSFMVFQTAAAEWNVFFPMQKMCHQ